MPDDPIKGAIAAAEKKKAKLKKLDKEPEGTKAKKLDKDVMKALEESFPKAKLKNVRVHTGGNATEMAKSLKAKAFTMGSDIYLAKPGDAKNKTLLAHELTHVIQQSQGKMPKPMPGKALTSK